MSGVRGFFEKIKRKASFVWPLETMDFGQLEFGIRDLNGYTLVFAEDGNRIRFRRPNGRSEQRAAHDEGKQPFHRIYLTRDARMCRRVQHRM